jgi:hypothetical protein
MFPPSVPFPVYTSREWWSDNFDATSYGIIFDERTSFFHQLASLQKKYLEDIFSRMQMTDRSILIMRIVPETFVTAIFFLDHRKIVTIRISSGLLKRSLLSHMCNMKRI